MPFLKIDSISKSYGKVNAVSDFSISIDKGQIYALIGPDGAGKTTIMRTVCRLLDSDKGTITIDDVDISKDFDKIKTKLGYMPQIFSLYPDLTVEENLIFYGGIYGITGDEFDKRAERMYGFSNLKAFRDRRALALSGGMKQKLALSCALIHEPELLLLDEPTTGVDPLSRRQFWEILLDLKKQGVAILVSTPYMDEAARADKVGFIYEGTKLAEDSPKNLPNLFNGTIYYLDEKPEALLVDNLNKIDGLNARRFGAGMHLYMKADDNINRIETNLIELGVQQNKLKQIQPDLEDCFIQLMERQQ
jgi:ABC-type multidrug transport system ATPase subunit